MLILTRLLPVSIHITYDLIILRKFAITWRIKSAILDSAYGTAADFAYVECNIPYSYIIELPPEDPRDHKNEIPVAEFNATYERFKKTYGKSWGGFFCLENEIEEIAGDTMLAVAVS